MSSPPPLPPFLPKYVPVPDSTVFSIGPVGELPVAKYNTIPCWDLVSDNSHSTGEPPPLEKYMLLSLCHNAAAGSPDCWSLPAIIRLEYARQSVAVPLGECAGNDLYTKYDTISLYISSFIT